MTIRLKWRQLLRKVFLRIPGKSLLVDRNVRYAKDLSRQLDAVAAEYKPDLIVSPMSLNVAYVTYPAPVVIWHDTSFGGVLDYYPVFTNLMPETVRAGHEVERASLHHAGLVAYSSDWAVRNAHTIYEVPMEKLRVIPYGANFPSGMSREEVTTAIQSRPTDRLELLFLGVLWERKGADIALEAAKALYAQGVNVRLRMAGVKPPEGVEIPPYVEVLGFISKATPEGTAQLNALFRESHFLILPTRAECAAMVVNEAFSFGTPALVTDTGGNSTAAKHGLNSMLFRLEDRGEAYAKVAAELWANREAYLAMGLAAFDDYTARLSWEAAGRGFRAAVRDVLGLE